MTLQTTSSTYSKIIVRKNKFGYSHIGIWASLPNASNIQRIKQYFIGLQTSKIVTELVNPDDMALSHSSKRPHSLKSFTKPLVVASKNVHFLS